MPENPFAPPHDVTAPADGAQAPSPDANVTTAAEPAPADLNATQKIEMQPPALSQDDAPVAWPPGDEPPAQPRRSGGLGGRAVALVAVGALALGTVGGFGGAAIYDSLNGSDATGSTPPASNDTVNMSRVDGSVASIAEAVLPSVVQIEANVSGGGASTGSGFIFRSDGYIVTNNHVVDGATGPLRVLMADGSVVEGSVVGATAEYDLAVVKIDQTGLAPLELGDSDTAVVGDSVVAVGSPLGLDATVTAGIISALHRPVTTGSTGTSASFIDAIQTDAAINPGNSGGPLINAAGQVIGINSAVAALPGASEATGAGSVGLGFAIPSNQVRRTVDELIATGTATYPVIGVQLDQTYTGEGVKVAEEVDGESGVVAGSPADLAGIEPGDIITTFEGRPMARVEDLVVAIRAQAPGDTVTFTVMRDGQEREVAVTLAANTEVNYGDEQDQ